MAPTQAAVESIRTFRSQAGPSEPTPGPFIPSLPMPSAVARKLRPPRCVLGQIAILSLTLEIRYRGKKVWFDSETLGISRVRTIAKTRPGGPPMGFGDKGLS